jgi:NAD-dependent dihydropyrimidine dehydrogenase PreA subunit
MLVKSLYKYSKGKDMWGKDMILPELFNMPKRVIIDQHLCLNSRFCNMRCCKCESICPHHSVTIDPSNRDTPVVIGESCTGCGLCMTECPTRAIHLDLQIHNSLINKDGITDLFCTRLVDKGGFVPCMGLLDAYALVYIGMNVEQVNIILDHLLCEACNPGVVEYMKKLACAANEFLHKLDKPSISLSFKRGSARGNLSRRALFSFCFSKIKETVIKTIPLSVGEEQTYRGLLLKDMQQYIHGNSMHSGSPLFWGAKVNDECDLCGVCVRSCKNTALVIKINESEEKIELYHNQSKCIGCLVCSLICPKSAIEVSNEESKLSTVIDLLSCSIASRNAVHCNSCGALMVSNTHSMCEACQYQKNRRIQTIY